MAIETSLRLLSNSPPPQDTAAGDGTFLQNIVAGEHIRSFNLILGLYSLLLQASYGLLDKPLMLAVHGEEEYKDRTSLQGNLLWDCGSVEVHVCSPAWEYTLPSGK